MFIDSHNHTIEFSSDAKMTVQELLAAAQEKGIDGVVITEHMEMDFPHKTETPLVFDPDAFFQSFAQWQEMNQTDVVLLAGIEFGYQKHLVNVYEDMSARYPFDSIILSNHLFQGKDPYFFRDCYQLPKSELFTKYILEMTDMVNQMSGFDIVGHYDYIARYSDDPSLKICYNDAPEAFDSFIQSIISKKKSLEVNVRSIYKMRMAGVTNATPDRKILSKYLEAGGNRISIGSDSHDPSTVGIYFDEIAKYLKEIGFTYLTYYVKRKEHHITL